MFEGTAPIGALDISIDVAAENQIFPTVAIQVSEGGGHAQPANLRGSCWDLALGRDIFEHSAWPALEQSDVLHIGDQHVHVAVVVEVAQVNAAGTRSVRFLPGLLHLPVVPKIVRIDVAGPGHVAEKEARRVGDLALGDCTRTQPAALL